MLKIRRFMSIQTISSLLLVAGFGGTAVSVHNQYEEAKQQHYKAQSDMQRKNEALHKQVEQLQQQTAHIQSSLQQKDAELQLAKKQLQEQEYKMEEFGISLPSRGNEDAAVRTFYVKATAYSSDPAENGGTYNGKVVTKTGFSLTDNPHAKVIAVDPNIIPLGSTVWVEGYGYAKALDTGGAIQGHRIDVFIDDRQKMNAWGVRTVKVRVLTEGH